MRRADRLFDIIQVLRTAKRPTTAAALADHLERFAELARDCGIELRLAEDHAVTVPSPLA